jgi:methyltransferase (TIGR00027 family)
VTTAKEPALSQTEPLVRNISDTALWTALYRAEETARPDALFRDPYAKRLAGQRGAQIADTMPFSRKNAWSFLTRTVIIDEFIRSQVAQGVDMVLNLAAGLDTRPYRMELPASLQWIEVDLPDLLAYKEEVLGDEKPVCQLERVRLDLANVAARREAFEQWGRRASKVLVITEGLLIYLTAEEVSSLGQDLAAPPSFQRWIVDLASPGLLQMLQKAMGSQLASAGATFKFGPERGPDYFVRCGWKPLDVRNLLKTAARLKRLTFFMRLIALLPASNGKQGKRPWGGVCLLGKQ